MQTPKLPQNGQLITPYLVLDNAVEFFDFMQAVFSAENTYGPTLDDSGNIRHGNVNVSGSQIMYCSSLPTFPHQPASLFIYVDDCDQVYKKAIETGATTVTEPADQAYGRSCGVNDPFGNTWWITSV